MTLFYAPPWRAFLYTNYLIIYVSVKWLARASQSKRGAAGVGQGMEGRREEKVRQVRIAQVGQGMQFLFLLHFYYAYFL